MVRGIGDDREIDRPRRAGEMPETVHAGLFNSKPGLRDRRDPRRTHWSRDVPQKSLLLRVQLLDRLERRLGARWLGGWLNHGSSLRGRIHLKLCYTGRVD